jgi:hypothetical protein
VALRWQPRPLPSPLLTLSISRRTKLLACGFSAVVSSQRPSGDGALWEIWAAGASHASGSSYASGSSFPGHSAAAVPVGLLGSPYQSSHNIGPCSRPGEDNGGGVNGLMHFASFRIRYACFGNRIFEFQWSRFEGGKSQILMAKVI